MSAIPETHQNRCPRRLGAWACGRVYRKFMRTFTAAITLLVFFGTLAPALATGTLRKQDSDGKVSVYNGVSIKAVHRTLRITSADGKGTLVINQAACSYVGQIQRCYPLKVSLEQSGTTKLIDLQRGTIYVNTTGTTQQMPFSSQQLPPMGILLSLTTKIGTYVTMTGKVDGIVR
jgi:hypothetical protein